MERLKIDDFLRYKFLSNPTFSPNGESLAFMAHESDLDENGYHSTIWLYELSKKNTRQLTTFGQEKIFIWFDEQTLLFSSLREEKDKKRKEAGEPFTIFYRIDIFGGEAAKAFEIPAIVTRIEKLNQNQFVLTAIYDNNMMDISKMGEKEKEEYLKKLKEEKDYQILDEIPFWSNGGGFTNKKRIRLFLFDLQTLSLLPITDEFTNVENFSLNEDRTKLLFIANSFKDKMEIRSDLYLYNILDGKLSKLTHEDTFDYNFAYFMKDLVIFTGSNMKNYGINENPKFYLLDPKTSQVACLTPNFDLSLHNSVNSDCRYGNNRINKVDGEYLYFITTEWHSSFLNRVGLSGKIERLTRDNGSVDGFDVINGKVVFVGLKDMYLQELYELVDGEERKVTFFNDWVHREKTVSKPERFEFVTNDGSILEGWILKPVDFDPLKKYPSILDIHGGPKTVYGEVFFHEMQLWANEGYVVLYTNPRGSDGRGNTFADIRGRYGTIDYEDLMNFVDESIKRFSFIDEQRMGVTGGSYGGYMTNWIIGQTDRFRAAVSQRSIANWISKFGTTDIGYFFVPDQHLGTPWSNFEKLWWHSPMKYANCVKTPTLFIHSDEDYRCWLAEAIQMFTSLKYHGVDSKLVIFKGENHELSRSGKPKHRLRRLKEITDWFNKYLK